MEQQTGSKLGKHFPDGSDDQESACNAGDGDPWVGKIPWSRKWQPTPVFLPGKFHGQKNLVGSRPWDHKESDMTEHTHTPTHTPHPHTHIPLGSMRVLMSMRASWLVGDRSLLVILPLLVSCVDS